MFGQIYFSLKNYIEVVLINVCFVLFLMPNRKQNQPKIYTPKRGSLPKVCPAQTLCLYFHNEISFGSPLDLSFCLARRLQIY